MKKKRESTTKAASWLTLVAATSLGTADVGLVQADITADEDVASDHDYQLVVQSYEAQGLDGGRPTEFARPLAATLRIVTPDELRRGVRVDLVSVGAATDPVIVAWLERREVNLEFDGLRARPGENAAVGAANGAGSVRLVLTKSS